jgi:hypothetical protein
MVEFEKLLQHKSERECQVPSIAIEKVNPLLSDIIRAFRMKKSNHFG